jgi:hypothetical protein
MNMDAEFLVKWKKGSGFIAIRDGEMYNFNPPRMLEHELVRFHDKHPRVRKFRVLRRFNHDRKPLVEFRIERAIPVKEKKLNRILAMESVLIELSLRSRSDDPKAAWSSRVQAERLYALAHGTSSEKPIKPWEHFK